MNLKLRPVEDPEEARALAPLLERAANESARAFSEEDAPEGTARRFLERSFARPETLLVVAEAEGYEEPLALCLTAPLEDPWDGRLLPLVVALWVAPSIRHRGVARALVREVGRLLGRRPVGPLAARTAHNDDAVLSMGERWGFVRVWELLVQED